MSFYACSQSKRVGMWREMCRSLLYYTYSIRYEIILFPGCVILSVAGLLRSWLDEVTCVYFVEVAVFFNLIAQNSSYVMIERRIERRLEPESPYFATECGKVLKVECVEDFFNVF